MGIAGYLVMMSTIMGLNAIFGAGECMIGLKVRSRFHALLKHI